MIDRNVLNVLRNWSKRTSRLDLMRALEQNRSYYALNSWKMTEMTEKMKECTVGSCFKVDANISHCDSTPCVSIYEKNNKSRTYGTSEISQICLNCQLTGGDPSALARGPVPSSKSCDLYSIHTITWVWEGDPNGRGLVCYWERNPHEEPAPPWVPSSKSCDTMLCGAPPPPPPQEWTGVYSKSRDLYSIWTFYHITLRRDPEINRPVTCRSDHGRGPHRAYHYYILLTGPPLILHLVSWPIRVSEWWGDQFWSI